MAAELASTKLNPDSHLLLDQPLLKVPHELERKNLKSTRALIEHEEKTILKNIKNIQSLASDPTNNAALLNQMDALITRLENVKRKLEALRAEEEMLHRQTKARIQHLQDLHEIPSLADVKYEQWAAIRLNRLLADYLLRCGYGESARALAKAVGIEDLVDIEAFVQCSQIEVSLDKRSTKECLAWCRDNKQALKKNNSDLEFELRLQQFIELVRTGKRLEARNHAKEHLTNHLDPIEAIKASALLAYSPETPVEPYKTLFSPERWAHLRALFLKTHHDLLALPARPALHVALSAGLSTLKTPSCHSVHAASSGNASTAISGRSVCPICSTELNELARNVPYAHHAKSSVESDPVVLPNGRIYGRERLLRLNEKLNQGFVGDAGVDSEKVRDPMDPSVVYNWSEVKKVYIS